jgi:choline-sulfatase
MSRKPNFLFVQADQLAARALRAYGNTVSKTPNIDKLAERGLVFEHAYCNYPLCAPSRFSMLSGLLPSNAGAYDNGAEFPASMLTFIHYLRLLGYQTCLAGKMHFIGPDQLHGFEERLTTDIYPSDFNWTADWTRTVTGTERLLAAAGEVNGILNSGVYERTIQLDFDDEVAFKAIRKIHDLARSDDQRPFGLFVSFTHPHDPFAVPGRYWNRYRHEDIDMPAVAPMPREDLDPHSRRLYDHIGVAEADMTEANVRVARHAYYGAVSYIDDQLGNLLEALKVAGLADSTIVVFLSDHGEALGERGLWFKRSFFDCALQIPLIVSAPSLFSPSRRDENVSLIDLFPTVIDLADPDTGLSSVETKYDGRSLRPQLQGEVFEGPDRAFAEMTGEGLDSPAIMVMEGRYKYIHCDDDPPLLFDRAVDWKETENLVGRAEVADVEARLASIVENNWDLAELKGSVLESQAQRRLIDRAHSVGRAPSWDYDALSPGHTQYFRPCAENPSASNYNSAFEVRARPDAEKPNQRNYP